MQNNLVEDQLGLYSEKENKFHESIAKSLVEGKLSESDKQQYWDTFSSDVGNYNLCISGNSGSGKSYLVKEIIARRLSEGGKIFIVDDCKEYDRFTRELGGEVIEIGKCSNISLNPFGMINKDLYEDSEYHQQEMRCMISRIIRVMAKSGDSEEEKAAIDQAVQLVLEKKLEQGSINDVIEELSDNRIADNLQKFLAESRYGSCFRAGKVAEFKKNLTYFSIAGGSLKAEEPLLMAIMLMVNNEILQSEENIEKSIIIESAERFHEYPSLYNLLEDMMRRARPRGAGFITTAQSIKKEHTIWRDSSHKIFLKTNHYSVDRPDDFVGQDLAKDITKLKRGEMILSNWSGAKKISYAYRGLGNE